MNKVNILFFGFIVEKVGVSSMQLEAGKSLREAIEEVGCNDISPLLVAVNQVQENDMSVLLHAGDEVAIMPPFSGG
ncbi:MAG: MoaD/ThiS family protein [Mariprofundaceae bacterium]|nr:MoaD/ThiS family protein [Mariprofundaceae bacterium]